MPLCQTMRTVFWDAKEFMFDEFLPHGETINAAHCLQILNKPFFGLWDKCPGKKNIVLQHDSTQPHTAHLWMERFQKNSWGTCPPPILQSIHSHLFRFINDQMQGQHYATSKAIQGTYFIFYKQLKWISTEKKSSDLMGKMHWSELGFHSEYSAQIWLKCSVFLYILWLGCEINFLIIYSTATVIFWWYMWLTKGIYGCAFLHCHSWY